MYGIRLRNSGLVEWPNENTGHEHYFDHLAHFSKTLLGKLTKTTGHRVWTPFGHKLSTPNSVI